MAISIPATVQENVFKYRFKKYLVSQNLNKTGNTNVITDRIENHINSEARREFFLGFLQEELKFGKNKKIYYTKLMLSSITYLRSLSNLEELLQNKNINITNFNNLLCENPTDDEVLYLNITTSRTSQVDNIELCIFKDIPSSDDSNDSMVLTNYVWVEINTIERTLTIRLRPYPLPSMQKGFTTNKLYGEILKLLNSIFRITIVDSMELAKSTLYKMYKDYIVSAELPYREELDKMTEEINESQKPILSALGIELESDLAEHIISRYKRLLERMLIIDDMDNYNSYHEDRTAIVERISITDDTGANANVLSGDEDGLDVAKIYFDIRETIDEIKKLDKVWIKWFFENDNTDDDIDEEIEQIEMFPEEVIEELEVQSNGNEVAKIKSYSTRFISFRRHVEITFLTKQSVEKEVQDHVLSCFREFEHQ